MRFLHRGLFFLGNAIRFLQERNGKTCHDDTYHRHQLDEDIERLPSSIIFLALSHAPPEFDMKTASVKPAARPPVRRPSTPATPKTRPTTIGMMMARRDGIIISRCALRVLVCKSDCQLFDSANIVFLSDNSK